MNTFDQVSLVIAAAGVVLNGVLFVVVVLQLRAVRRQAANGELTTLLDHQRRKKQATIEFYSMTIQSHLSLPPQLPFDREGSRIDAMFKRLGQTDTASVRMVYNYLSLFELLATGVNTDVFDLEIVRRMAGGRVRAMAKNYRPWIEARRESQHAPLLFEELYQLARRLQELEDNH